eukprot:2776950-Amphidinium_carterae.1
MAHQVTVPKVPCERLRGRRYYVHQWPRRDPTMGGIRDAHFAAAPVWIRGQLLRSAGSKHRHLCMTAVCDIALV